MSRLTLGVALALLLQLPAELLAIDASVCTIDSCPTCQPLSAAQSDADADAIALLMDQNLRDVIAANPETPDLGNILTADPVVGEAPGSLTVPLAPSAPMPVSSPIGAVPQAF